MDRRASLVLVGDPEQDAGVVQEALKVRGLLAARAELAFEEAPRYGAVLHRLGEEAPVLVPAADEHDGALETVLDALPRAEEVADRAPAHGRDEGLARTQRAGRVRGRPRAVAMLAAEVDAAPREGLVDRC